MESVDPVATQPDAVAEAERAGFSAYITIGIIALNTLVFVLMVIKGVSFLEPSPDSVLHWGANYGPMTLGGQWWRMFASLFLHFGIMHLLFNMIVLASIGIFMETLLGRTAFLILYVVAGLGGGVASLVWHPWTVSAGASGAIFGLYGALLGFLLTRRNLIPAEELKSLSKGALIFIGYNLVYGLARPEVDLAAHLGGLSTGFLLGLFLVKPVSPETPAGPKLRDGLAIALGLAMLAVTVVALPKPDDLRAEVQHMADMEDKSLALYNDSIHKWKAHQLTDQQFEDIIEHQLLPTWHAERAALAQLHRLSKEQTQLALSLVQYMAAREDGWTLLADGLRTGDDGKIKKSTEKSAEADHLAEEIGADAKKKK